MLIPLAINISMTIAVLGGFVLPFRWMILTWIYAAGAYYVIQYFYPEYWLYISSLAT